MPRGKPWSVEEERCLRGLVDNGLSLRQIAAKMGKSVDSVRQKMFKLGLKEQQQEKTRCPSSSSMPPPEELPTVEEIMKDLVGAMHALKQPGLNHAEVQRLRSIIQAAKTYKEMYADYAHYLEIEEKLKGVNEMHEKVIKRNAQAPQH